MHILDVLPEAYAAAPGGPEAAWTRARLVNAMMASPPPEFVTRGAPQTPDGKVGVVRTVFDSAKVAFQGFQTVMPDGGAPPQECSLTGDFGWKCHCKGLSAPSMQIMSREGESRIARAQSLPSVFTLDEGNGMVHGAQRTEVPPTLERAWSIAY